MIFYSEIDECESMPCANGGTCANLIDGFECMCIAGFNGTQCENSKTLPISSYSHEN